MREFISLCEQFTIKLIRASQNVIDSLSISIYDSFASRLPDWVLALIPNNAVNVLSSYSLIDLMFGSGLLFFIGYTLWKFLRT